MFIEPVQWKGPVGWIEVIAGSMFSGKTEELIRRLKRAKIANQSIQIFKPAIDSRYHKTDVVSHDSHSFTAQAIEGSSEILSLFENAAVVGIDEAQFFDPPITAVCEQLAQKGVRVIVAGLNMDYLGKPFGPMPQLLAIADYITILHAICVRCGRIARISHRKDPTDEQQTLVGSAERYEPLCRTCFYQRS